LDLAARQIVLLATALTWTVARTSHVMAAQAAIHGWLH
jgi:hypothetical protein